MHLIGKKKGIGMQFDLNMEMSLCSALIGDQQSRQWEKGAVS